MRVWTVIALSAVLIATVLASDAARAEGEALNVRAMALAQNNNPTEARPLFRAATKADPTNGEYWNNLGVCLMRLRAWGKAVTALKRGVAIGNDGARKNLSDLERYLSQTGVAVPDGTESVDDDSDAGAGANAVDAAAEAAKKANKKKKKDKKKKAKADAAASATGTAGAAATETPDGRPKPKFLPKPVYTIPAGLPIRPRRAVPRFTLAELYAPGNEKYANGLAPYVITGAMKDWPASKKWTLEYFMNQFGASVVDFYPHNMAKHDTHPYLTNMLTAINELVAPSGTYPHDPYSPGVYLQWNVNPTDWEELLQDTKLPYYFRRDEEWLRTCLGSELEAEYTKRVHWRMMLIGSKGAGMFVHYDVLQTSSWQAQVVGAKKWFLCAPDQSGYMYGAGKVDVFNPDYQTYPLFAQSDCYETVVEQGEMVYYPANYWHQTENMAPVNIAMSATVSDENNYLLVGSELKAECATQKFKWRFSPELCKSLDTLYKFWEDRYAPRNAGECELRAN